MQGYNKKKSSEVWDRMRWARKEWQKASEVSYEGDQQKKVCEEKWF